MNLSRLICIAFISVLACAGCHPDGQTTGSSGTTSSPAALPTGSGTATLSWEAPTTTTTGQSLTDLSGYRIYYGMSAEDLSQTIQLAGVGLQTYVIDNLGQGTWYFAVRAVTSAGAESALSNIVSKTIS